MIGSHLSVAGGMTNALVEAEALDLDCVQVFTKNQQQWAAPPLTPEVIAGWRAELERLGWHSGPPRTVSHASYLANLASPDDALRAKSIALIQEELSRCERLGIGLLVMHPGAFTTATLDEGIERIAAACAGLLAAPAVAGSLGRPVLCLENVAGQGSTIGRRFEELTRLRERIEVLAPSAKGRVGFCIDTCHAHAAGYDLSDARRSAAALKELENTLGAEHVHCLHLNDSKAACGSRVDRHEHIGRGTIGLAGFGPWVNHPRLGRLPMIMETPKGEDAKGRPWDEVNAAALRGLLAEAPPRAARPERAATAKPVRRTKPSGRGGRASLKGGPKPRSSRRGA